MMKHKDQNCECYACKYGKEFVNEIERNSMIDYGWFAHYVANDPNTPFGVNYHTHGLVESFGHQDIQFCFPAPYKQIHSIMFHVVEEIKGGCKFEPGKKYQNILNGNFDVEFIEAMECGRKVLRMCLPDKNNKFEGDFAKQFENTGL